MHQSFYSPKRGGTQREHKSDVDATSTEASLAPTLEHGRQSNEEEDDGDNCESFDPHKRLTGAIVARRPALRKDGAHSAQ